MDEISFLLHGRRLRLSRQQVIDRLRGVEPKTIHTWAVEVEGRPFPVKQALVVAAGVNRRDFNSHQARDLLIRLGFHVVDVGRRRTIERSRPTSPMNRRPRTSHRTGPPTPAASRRSP